MNRRRAVLNLTDARPAWRIPRDAIDAITCAFPAGWEVVAVHSPVDGRGDGGGVSEEALAAVAGAEVCISFGMPRELFLAASLDPRSELRWVHTATAGVTALLYPEMLASPVILTNSAGVHAPAIAETVIAMVLYFARGVDVSVHAQRSREWRAGRFEHEIGLAREVAGATIGIIGLGGIGLEVAARARALGMRVIAVRGTQTAAPDGIRVLAGDGALAELLGHSDYVAICAPSTPETRGMIGTRAIDAMKRDAVLINVSRGDIIDDEHTLAEALADGRLRGAALDVFHVEPLPASSPLWDLPNVLVTPHVSGVSQRFWDRETELIIDNTKRYLNGEPLENVVDKRRGY